jgi:hypothetical protein
VQSPRVGMSGTGISWRSCFLIFGICWASGVVVGIPMFIARDPSMTWLDWPLAVPAGAVIAFPFAAVAAVAASICVLVARRHGGTRRGAAAWVGLGTVSGAVVGTVPFACAVVAVGLVSFEAAVPLLREVGLVLGVPGAVAGAAVGLVQARDGHGVATAQR